MRRTLRLLPLLLAFAPAFAAHANDVKGSKDHPLLTRFSGASINAYAQVDYDEARLPNKPIEYNYKDMASAEGRITRIGYTIPGGRSTLEVGRNYEQALAAGKFQMAFSCKGRDCGGGFDSAVINSGNVIPDRPRFEVGFSTEVQRAYLAKRSDQAGDTWVFIYVMAGSKNETYVYEQIVEPKAMQTGQVQVLDAKSMQNALGSEGKVALYGIYFDTDKAEVKPESKAELAEMAKLLNDNPKLRVYVVGHTDNQGQLAHNLELSQRRADAVVKALATDYKVPTARLSAKSVASLAPLASNADEAGRAKNRRVELVVQ
jgi:outer membrane protein OmpA-like peptidoglycan-associated protein